MKCPEGVDILMNAVPEFSIREIDEKFPSTPQHDEIVNCDSPYLTITFSITDHLGKHDSVQWSWELLR